MPLSDKDYSKDEQGFLLQNQSRLWFEWKKDPDSTAYSNLFCFHLKGKLNDQLLIKSANLLIEQYQALSSYFIEEQSTPKKYYANRRLSVPFETVTDFNLSEEASVKTVDDYLHRPFDLAVPPLYRCILVHYANDHYIFGIGFHHCVEDAISIKVMLERLSANYNQLFCGQSVTTFRNKTEDIRAFDKNNLLYFSTKLQSVKNYTINIPSQYVLSKQRPTSRRIYRNLTMQSSKNIMNFLAEHKLTLFTLLISLLSVKLKGISSENQFAIGYSISTRERHQLASVGFYANNLPMIFNFDDRDEMTFADLVKNVAWQRNHDFLHKHLPHTNIIKIARDNNKKVTSLFNVLVSQFTNISFPIRLKKIVATPIPILGNDAKNDLTLFFDYAHVIKLEIEYRDDRYDGDFIDMLFSSMVESLVDIQRQYHLSISDMIRLSYASPAETFYHFDQSLLKNASIAMLLVHSFHHHYDNIALVDDEKSISYQVLDQLSNKVARFLQQYNELKQGDIVVVLANRSIDTMIVIIALFKLAVIYLPISPTWPKQRLQLILEHAKPNIILVDDYYDLNDMIPVVFIGDMMTQDSNDEAIDIRNQHAKQPSYLIYTSGSTGEPKAIINNQYGVLNRVFWMIKECSITSQDVFLQKTPLTFDVSLWEILTPLMVGATLYIAKPDGHKNPDYLRFLIILKNISIIHFVPSMLTVFLDTVEKSFQHHLRYVLTSGEVLQYQDVETFNKMMPQTKLYNLYGPTEASIEVTYWPCQSRRYKGFVPIGYPLPNIYITLLNQKGDPVPIGVCGEIYIGECAITEGYYKNQKLTKSAFIDNRFDGGKTKLYKTGDLACWLPDGAIRYLGRTDDQIKLHGCRIELSEIDTYLSLCDGIKRSVSCFFKHGSQERLITFIQRHKNCQLTVAAIKNFLNNRLPTYAVPKEYVFVHEFLLSSSGKVDRQLMLERYIKQNKQTIKRQALASNQLESSLVSIWREILGDQLNIIHHDSDFIDLGGYSLALLVLTNKINKYYYISLTMADILQNTLFGQQLALISQYCKSFPDNHRQDKLSATPSASLLSPKPIENHVFSRQQHYLLKKMVKNNIVLPCDWRGLLSQDKFQQACRFVVERHEMLRSIFYQDSQGHWLKRHRQWSKSYVIFIEENQDAHMALATDIEKDLLTSVREPNELLFQMYVIKLSSRYYRILFYVNHLIVDRASLLRLFNELFLSYDALIQGKGLCLSQPHDYHHYIKKEQQFINSNCYDRQKRFWLDYLAISHQNDNLFSILNSSDDRASQKEQPLTRDQSDRLNRLIANYHKTAFIITLAVVEQTIGQIFANQSFNIGFTLSNRYQVDYAKALGPISNRAFIYINSSKLLNFTQLVSYNDQSLQNIYNNCDISMDEIEGYLKIKQGKDAKLYSIFYDFESCSWYNTNMTGVEIREPRISHTPTMKNYLTIRLMRRGHQYILLVRYRTAIFPPQQIDQLISCFLNNIEQQSVIINKEVQHGHSRVT